VSEPIVRIRCRTPEEEARCRTILETAGFQPEMSLTWLVVRDAHPDIVNEVLVKGGAFARVAAREQIARLVAYLIDRQGKLDDRAMNIKNLAGRVLEEAGLTQRYTLRTDAEMVASAKDLYERLMATAAGFIPWEDFIQLFCVAQDGASRGGQATFPRSQ
jgi:hypothetical protein